MKPLPIPPSEVARQAALTVIVALARAETKAAEAALANESRAAVLIAKAHTAKANALTEDASALLRGSS